MAMFVTDRDSSSPDDPIVPPEFNVAEKPVATVTSVAASPPSVMAPVRAVKVALFEPACKPVTEIEPPTIVTGSLNVELSTSTAPVPFVASPIVIELKPSCRKPNSVSSMSSVPVGPPMLMSRLVVCGAIVRVLVPLTFAPIASVSVAMATAPAPALTAWLMLTVSAVTFSDPPPVLVALVWKLTTSVPSSPLIVKDAVHVVSTPWTLIVSSSSPALIVRDVDGALNVVVSNVTGVSPLRRRMTPSLFAAVSSRIAVFAVDGRLNTRLVAVPVPVSGSRPAYVTMVEPSATTLPELAAV